MMRRIAIAAVSLLILLMLAGCTGNLFMEWDQPDVPSVSEINNKDVSSQSGADNFLSDVEDWYDGDALSGDKETSDAVVTKLKAIYEDPDNKIDDETEQKAAALAGKIAIQSVPNAEELSKNLVGSFDELSGADSTTAEELLRSIVPQEAMDDRQAFNVMIDTLISASEAYVALGDSIGSDGSYISDSELGVSVQLGAVAVAVEASLDALNGDLDGNYQPGPDGYDSLYRIVTGQEDFVNYPSAAEPMDAFTSDTGEYSGMYNLLDAAGLSFN